MKNSSKIVREGGGLAAVRAAEISERFLPLAELWEADGSAGEPRPNEALDLKKRQDEILEQARQEAEEIRKRARDEGYAKGEQEGRQ
nr:hypothetical protein [Desulfobacteraceae bacterium]